MKGWWRYLRKTLIWLVSITLSLMLIITLLLVIYKKEIIDYAVGEINKNLKSEVRVKEIDLTFWATFPNLSIDFNEVFIQDAVPNSTRLDTLFQADQMRLKFNPWDVWNERYHVKALEINNGTVHLKIDKKGRENYDILKESEDNSSSDFDVKLKGIELNEIQFIYSNQVSEQIYSAKIHEAFLNGSFDAKKFTVATNASMTIQKIQNGLVPFVVNKPALARCSVNVDNEKNTISIPNGEVVLAKLPFSFNLLLQDSSLHTEVSAEKLSFQDVANNLSATEVDQIDRFKGSGTVDFHLELDNELRAESSPLIDCSFNIHNGKLTEPENNVTVSSIQLNGIYSTLKGKGNEELALKNLSFLSASGAFNGACMIQHFNAPRYSGKANGAVDLAMLHALFHFPKMKTVSGKVDLRTVFDLQTIFVENEPEIEIVEGSGSAQFKNSRFQMEHDSRIFENINGTLLLNRTEAALQKCEVHLGSSELFLNGYFNNIDGFLQNRTNLTVDVTADSKHIDLADFTNSLTLGETGANGLREFMLPDQIDGSVVLDIRKLKLDSHYFKDLHGNMQVGPRQLKISKLFGRSADASVSGTVVINETAPEYFQMASSLYSSDIQFRPLFKEWNNFDQDVITAENISGRAEILLDLKAPFSFSEGIIKKKIEAEMKVKVFNGSLKNVSTFKALTADLKTPKTRVVLKSRDVEALEGKLDNIKFETLENTIFIKNSTIYIPKMEIHSSALDITTIGTHTFNNDIDYRFAFRMRDLKVRKDESEFGIVEDDNTGIKIFVRMYGNLDDPTIEWDKDSKQEQARENRELVKTETMSILKSELGLFKKDTTVKTYQPKVKQREVLEIKFGEEEKVDPVEVKKEKEKKQTKLNQTFEKLKEQGKKEKQEEFTVD